MKGQHGTHRILVVNEDPGARSESAIILSTHGYDVDTIGGAADRDPGARYDLVALSWSKRLRDDWGLWRDLQKARPGWRFTFLPDPRHRLARVTFNGRQVRAAEGMADLVALIAADLATGAR